jgi:hypothetical protein
MAHDPDRGRGASAAGHGFAQSVNGVPSAGSADARLQEDAALRDSTRRYELAEDILAAREAAEGRSLGALQPLLKHGLVALPQERLEALIGGDAEAVAAALRETDPRILGDSAADLVFTPVTPCRILNTTVAGGQIAGGGTRNFVVKGATGFAAQGGNAAGCNIPTTATAVEMNFIAVGPAGAGDFRAYPWTAAPVVPNASVINYTNVAGLNIANGLAQPICNSATTTCTFDLIIRADVSASHAIVDVVGYYTPAPSPRTTQIIYSGETSAAPPLPGSFGPFKILGTFTKVAADTAIVVNWHGHVSQTGTPGTTFCQYQLRVEGAVPTGVTDANGLGVVLYGAESIASLTGRWTGLGIGNYQLALYFGGSATTCTMNFGNFSSQQVYVQEF